MFQRGRRGRILINEGGLCVCYMSLRTGITRFATDDETPAINNIRAESHRRQMTSGEVFGCIEMNVINRDVSFRRSGAKPGRTPC